MDSPRLPDNDPLRFRADGNGGYVRLTREELDAKLEDIIESWPRASDMPAYNRPVERPEPAVLAKTLSGKPTGRREPTARWLSK